MTLAAGYSIRGAIKRPGAGGVRIHNKEQARTKQMSWIEAPHNGETAEKMIGMRGASWQCYEEGWAVEKSEKEAEKAL